MTSHNKHVKAMLAAVAAATMTFVATPGIALAAPGGEAGNTATVYSEPAEPTSIPGKANLTVHKMTPADKDVPADGHLVNQLPGSSPIEGVTFTPYKVEGVDLSTNVGWRKANEVAKAWQTLTVFEKRNAIATGSFTVEGQKYTLSKQGAGIKTNGQGEAEFSDLPRALYVVGETIDGNVTVDGETYPKEAVIQVPPFVVALPMTDQKAGTAEARTQWLTDVHVYPKNSVTSAEKSVTDESAYGAGNEAEKSKITYHILTDVPKVANGLNRYRIIDPLDSRLTYLGGNGAQNGESVTVVNAGGDHVSDLTYGTDYTIITADVSAYAAAATNEKPMPGTFVTVNFTKVGRNKLIDIQKTNGEVKVKWDLPTQLKRISKDGIGPNPNEIPDQAILQPNVPNGTNSDFDPEHPYTPVTPDPKNPDNPGTPGKKVPPTPDNPTPNIPGVPTNKVTSKYGKVVLTKVGAEKAKLQGAEFQLYHCEKGMNDAKGKQYIKDANLISVNGVDKWTTDDQGHIVIDGLRLNDWKNDAKNDTDNPITDPTEAYCLKETKAPEGYELLPNLVEFQLLTTDADWKKELEITNVPKNGGFNLPLTGGAGVFPLIGLGGLLVVGAAGYAAVAARRNRNQA